MIQCRASYETAQKHYYTDRHDTIDNIKDRSERYIPLLDELSKRAPDLVQVDISLASEEAVKQTCKALD